MKPVKAMLAAVAVTLGGGAMAEDIDWKTNGAWPHLAPLIGTYGVTEVFSDPEARAAIDRVMGGDATALWDRLKVQGPMGFENDCLTVAGNMPHQGGSEMAALWLCLYKGEAHVALMRDGRIEIRSPKPDYSDLPNGLKAWVYFHSQGRFGPPDGIPAGVSFRQF